MTGLPNINPEESLDDEPGIGRKGYEINKERQKYIKCIYRRLKPN